ncbi:MAG TPA: YkgJ family cysteine cluster protein [Azospirillum sp.]|nr:YkgJ family cysteine cluster protein [Azospirillum sp.]
MNEGEAAAQSLCTACGLCCDGTLFGRTTVSPEHDGALLGLERFEGFRDQPALPQPCPALEGGRCAVYESRPRACRRYRCELLRKVDRAEVSYDEALRLIVQHRQDLDRTTKALEAAVRDQSLTLAERRVVEFERVVCLCSIRKVFQGKAVLT